MKYICVIFITSIMTILLWEAISLSDYSLKRQWCYNIEKEMSNGKHTFFVGKIKWEPTKYKGLWLTSIEKENQ